MDRWWRRPSDIQLRPTPLGHFFTVPQIHCLAAPLIHQTLNWAMESSVIQREVRTLTQHYKYHSMLLMSQCNRHKHPELKNSVPNDYVCQWVNNFHHRNSSMKIMTSWTTDFRKICRKIGHHQTPWTVWARTFHLFYEKCKELEHLLTRNLFHNRIIGPKRSRQPPVPAAWQTLFFPRYELNYVAQTCCRLGHSCDSQACTSIFVSTTISRKTSSRLYAASASW